jgi:peptidoglycan/xylan/chitin deacetylase (PgdA/CDA1 family)
MLAETARRVSLRPLASLVLLTAARSWPEHSSRSTTHAPRRPGASSPAATARRRGIRSLETGLGHPVQWFAYPFGAYDERVERLARRAGYVLAVTTETGTAQTRPPALRRLRVLDSTGVRGLAEPLSVTSR